MIQEYQFRLSPRDASQELTLIGRVSAQERIDANRVKHVKIIRKSIDARQRQVMVNVTVRAWIDEPYVAPEPASMTLPCLPKNAPEVIVVGMGPGGLFAAVELVKQGIRPIIIERGKDVDSRRKDLAAIARTGKVNPNSNYCFGEGGAGAFSDGKLFTRSKKRGNVTEVLQALYNYGAEESILIDAHPHIGTDRLPVIICNLRRALIQAGAEVKFETLVTGLMIEDNQVAGVKLNNGSAINGQVILATGHSARDVYHFLQNQGVDLEAKGLAIGVRLEHPQELIDKIRYHNPQGRGKYLPAAEYTMLTRVEDRGVYSFCMCPGGVVVPSACHDGEIAVNGMSASARSSRWANSGMVVEILPDDIPGDDPLRLMTYQQKIEKAFYEDGKSQNCPAQRMTDFVNQKLSSSLPSSSYAPGLHSARVDQLLPNEVSRRLRKGFEIFGQNNRGFLTPEATVIGCETRTSSPVRIPRDKETLKHIRLEGLYPVGEGAGYAGGIVSAALDGINAARAVAKSVKSGL